MQQDFDLDFGEKLYERIFRNASIGILVFNKDTRLISMNPQVEAYTGFQETELIGTQFFDVVVSDIPLRRKLCEQLQSGFETDLDAHFSLTHKKSGAILELTVTSSRVDPDGQSSLLVLLQNATNRRAFETVIESSFDKFIQTTIDLDAAMKKIREQSRVLKEYKNRTERELSMARDVQQAIIPQVFPYNENVEAWGAAFPSSELGGDYLDIFELSERKLAILMADVSGHGVPSALITMMTKVFFSNLARAHHDPLTVIQHVNAEMERIFNNSGHFLSAVYCVLDLCTLELQTVIAGHPRPICYIPSTDRLTQIGDRAVGAVLGIAPTYAESYTVKYDQLEEGSILIFYTDGVTEAYSTREGTTRLFGLTRLLRCIKTNVDKTPRRIIEEIRLEVDKYSEEVTATDDRAFIVLRIRKRKPEMQPDAAAPTSFA